MLSIYEIVAQTGAGKPPSYVPVYEKLFEPLRSKPLALLELGVFRGGSLKAWEAYFPHARIAGIDRDPPDLQKSSRVRVYKGDQTDISLLSQVAAEVAPEGFDIIIDDCAHIGALAKISFWYSFDNHLKPGGLYSIEDWGTGYWPTWPDGRKVIVEPDSERRMPSHDGGMVGFVKQLMDELAVADIKESVGSPAPRQSKFIEMSLHFGMCVVTKAPVGSSKIHARSG
jgi:SAM-dependent methyltransferase